jgi:hypothetical protein
LGTFIWKEIILCDGYVTEFEKQIVNN